VQDPFVVAFVVGVTPGKWARIWGERMSRPLELRPLPRDAALAALADGSAHAALVRLPEAGRPDAGVPEAGVPEASVREVRPPEGRLPEELSAIPLYAEAAVVVAPKDHPVTAFESVTLADLAAEVVLGAGAGSGGTATAGAAVQAGLPAEPDWAALIALVAANVGVAIVPQSVARALSRRDVAAIPITGIPETRIALVWVSARQIAETEEFIGIVRGRTANSSRGAGESGAGGAGTGSDGAAAGGAGAAGSGSAAKPKSSGSKSATPPRRDPRASRARRR
jgi:DNA-binding transcriptional LysR family regulator